MQDSTLSLRKTNGWIIRAISETCICRKRLIAGKNPGITVEKVPKALPNYSL